MTSGSTADLTPTPPASALLRVAALVTRDHPFEPHLLVLNPDDGPQHLPNAVVELTQTPLAAVRALTARLFGAQFPASERRIAIVRENLNDGCQVVLQRHRPRTGPSHDAPEMRFEMARGARVRVLERQNGFARVTHDEFVYHDTEVEIRTLRSGWLLADTLTNTIDHHLFHIRSPSGVAPVVPDAAWVQLSATHRLLPAHRRWLDHVRPRIRETRPHSG